MSSEYLFQPNRRLTDGVVICRREPGAVRYRSRAARAAVAVDLPVGDDERGLSSDVFFAQRRSRPALSSTQGSRRQYMSLQTDVIGPVFSKIWDTPGSGYSDRMKHVIEPTFSVDIPHRDRESGARPVYRFQRRRGRRRDEFTYGLTNRLIARTRGTGDARGSTREFLTVGVQQTYYTNPKTSRLRHHLRQLLRAAEAGRLLADRRHRPCRADADDRRKRAGRVRRDGQRPADPDRRQHDHDSSQLLERELQPTAIHAAVGRQQLSHPARRRGDSHRAG